MPEPSDFDNCLVQGSPDLPDPRKNWNDHLWPSAIQLEQLQSLQQDREERKRIAQMAGWMRLHDTVHLRKDSAFLAAVLGERGEQGIAPEKTLASQPSLSRLLDQLNESSNLRVLEETVT